MVKHVPTSLQVNNVQKIKLQLFHCLQRRHRDAWKRYWGSFQLYLVAKVSLAEFHALAEELLGPEKHVHNTFVMSLLSIVYQEAGDDEQLHTSPPPLPAVTIQDYNVDEGGEEPLANESTSTHSRNDLLLQRIKKEGSEQRQQEPLEGARPHRSSVSADKNVEATAATKLLHLDRDTSHNDDVHPDHQSAELLMGLGKVATTISSSPIAITPAVSTPSNSKRGLEPCVSTGSRRE